MLYLRLLVFGQGRYRDLLRTWALRLGVGQYFQHGGLHGGERLFQRIKQRRKGLRQGRHFDGGVVGLLDELPEGQFQRVRVLLHGDGAHVGGCALQVVGLADEPFPRRTAQTLLGDRRVQIQPLAERGERLRGVADIPPQDFLIRLGRDVEPLHGAGVEAGRKRGAVVDHRRGSGRGFGGLLRFAGHDFVRKQGPQGAEQGRPAERLGQIARDARGKRPHLVLVHGVRRDGDDGQPFQFRHGADDAGGFVSVHDRHLHVHEHEVEVFAPLCAHPECVERLLAVAHDGELHARVFKQGFHDFLIGRIVFGDQNADVVKERRFHRRGQGVEPPRVSHETGLVEGHDGFVQPAQGHEGQDRHLPVVLGGVPVGIRQDLLARVLVHEDGRDRAPEGRAQHAQGVERVRLRQLAVEEQQVRLLLGQVLRLAYGLFRGGRRDGGDAEGREMAAEHFRLERRSAEHERVDGVRRRFGQMRGDARGGLRIQRDGKRERAADVGFRLHPDFAVHHFDELAADAQAEAGPAVAARRGGVHLPERLEQLAQEFGGDAHAGVAYEADDLYALLVRGVGERYGVGLFEGHADLPAGAGEFYRVGHEVHDDLLQPPGVADQRELHGGLHVHHQFDAPGLRVVQGDGADVVDHVVEHEGGLLQFQMARFDFGDVEQVVDDFEQRAGRLEDGTKITVGRGLLLEQGEFGEGHDPVQRRADFVTDVGEELAFRGGGGVGGLFGELQFRVDGLQIAGALVDPVFQFEVGLFQHGPAFPQLLFGAVVLDQFLIELRRPARDLPLERKVPVQDEREDGKQHFGGEQHHPDRLLGERLFFVGLEPLLGDDPAFLGRDFRQRLVDDAVQFGPVLADAEGMPVRRVDDARHAEVADAAVADFFRDVELVVDHGVDFAERDLLQALKRVLDHHGRDFGMEFLEEVVP